MLALLTLSLLSSTPCPPGQLLEGGQHTRLVTRSGAVHLWCRAEVRSVVVYVHGYRDDVDSAFHGHQLAAQFAQSGVEALFVAVEAPSGPGQEVAFGDLDVLLEMLSVHVGAPLPEAVLVLGHSGGNRTLKTWLGSARVREVVLLDGFYDDSAPWTAWLAARPDARLRMVGQATWEKAEAWRLGLPRRLRGQVTHERAKCPHMDIVTRGTWLPRVVRESSIATPEVSASG